MEQIGPYRVLSRLGAGGFGEVFLTLDPEGRTAAVKVLHPHVAEDPAARERLATEVEAMRRVRSPHIAEVLGADMHVAQPYIATRYVQGRPLTHLAPLPGEDLVRLARGIAAALVTMADAGVVHRDLKPSNVIVAEGEPVVIDFGVASSAARGASTETLVGTPGYVAPEVLNGASYGPAADVFAWAATMAYAATGNHPFGVGPTEGIIGRVRSGEANLGGLPPWLEPLVRAGLAAAPRRRPTARRLSAELGAVPAEVTQVVREAETQRIDLPDTPRIEMPGAEPSTPTAGPPRFEDVLDERWRRQRRQWRERARPWLIGLGAVLLGVLAGALTEPSQVAAWSIQGGFVAILLVDTVVTGRRRAVFNVTSAAACVGLAQVLPLMLSSVWIWLILGGLVLIAILVLSLS